MLLLLLFGLWVIADRLIYIMMVVVVISLKNAKMLAFSDFYKILVEKYYGFLKKKTHIYYSCRRAACVLTAAAGNQQQQNLFLKS